MHRRLSLLVLLAACSKATPTDEGGVDTDDTDATLPEDTYVPPVDTEVDVDTDPPIQPSDACSVPTGLGLDQVCDLSVGSADVTTDPGGVHALYLQVHDAGAGSPGAFNGEGLGHRAIGGFHGYDKAKLADLGGLEVVARGVQETFDLVVALQVDLTCGRRDFHLLEAPLARVVDTVDAGDGRTRYRLPFDGAIWTASEAVTGTGGTILEKTTATGATPRTLLALLDAWPDACLRNVDAGFDDLPHHAVVSGVTLGVGSRSSYGLGALWEVTEVRIGDDVHLPAP